MLISRYGFMDVLADGRVVLDPSRVAAQVVTGIGFIGAGLIFVRQDKVQGLTTAATIWLVTGIGMACGAGLLLLALAVTLAYFVVAFVFPLLMRFLPLEGTARAQHSPGGVLQPAHGAHDLFKSSSALAFQHGDHLAGLAALARRT